MIKIFLFATIVIAGTVALIIVSNQNMSKSSDPGLNINGVSIFPTNVLGNNQINVTAAPAQTAVRTPTSGPDLATVEGSKSATATIKTSKGAIVLALYDKDAPGTVQNFITKAKSGFYNNLTMHRVEDWVIQGGDPKGDGTGGGKMQTELNNKPFVIGSLGVARGGDINVSNDAQFFITKKEASWLNGQYTNFGMVEQGIDVVEKIVIGDKILGITIE